MGFMNRGSDPDAERVRDLKRDLRDKALLLANLEVIIEDYRRERSELLQELRALREELWDLEGEQGSSEPGDDVPK
jgi:chromosome segregation ATPase